MTYQEYFQQMIAKVGHIATEQDIDEQIALLNQLPCTSGGVGEPLFAEESIGYDVRSLDSGEKFPGYPCLHCTWLPFFKWAKSVGSCNQPYRD